MATFLTCAKCQQDSLIPDTALAGIHPDDLMKFYCHKCDTHTDPDMLRRVECAKCHEIVIIKDEEIGIEGESIFCDDCDGWFHIAEVDVE